MTRGKSRNRKARIDIGMRSRAANAGQQAVRVAYNMQKYDGCQKEGDD